MHIKFAKIQKFAYADEKRKIKDFKRLKRDSHEVKSVKVPGKHADLLNIRQNKRKSSCTFVIDKI